MDDRYLYFALADRDYFDIPWSRSGGDQLHIPDELSPGWLRVAHGPWLMLHPPGVASPRAGWKVHVSALPYDAQRVVEIVGTVCLPELVPWKVLRSADIVRASQYKYAPRSMSGKVCTIYPCSDEQLARVVEQLATALAGTAAPQICGDFNHPSAPIGLRWGAFIEEWIEAPDGRLTPGVAGADGAIVPDDRLRPAPREMPTATAALMASTEPAAQLPVTDVHLVHRANAGAIYRATLEDGRVVALKEARHHAGLDYQGVDAVSRLRHEYAIFQRLSGHGLAPEPIDYWCHPTSDFLVMEWVDGGNMSCRISRDHPASKPGVSEEAAAAYWTWAISAIDDLESLVARLHEHGVAHGDLHPGNVMLGPDGLRVVDFECGQLDDAVVTRSIGTPGYQCDESDVAAKDRFCLQRVRMTLHDPDVALLDRRPDLADAMQVTGPLMAETAPTAGRTAIPADTVIPAGIDQMLDHLADGIVARATPERADRLFPGGIEQFTAPLGGHDILFGAAGVLLALDQHGRTIAPEHLDWLATLPTSASYERHGLLEGAEGIALALAVLGRPDAASEMVDRTLTTSAAGLSWTRGLAGVAVAHHELAQLLDRQDLADSARQVTDDVVAAVHHPRTTIPGPGLLHGWSGIALALLRIGELRPDLKDKVYAAAEKAVQRELELLRPMGDCLVAMPNGRVRTGLAHGSGAFVVAASALAPIDPTLQTAAASAARACLEAVSPLGGLGDGVAGEAVVLRAAGHDAAAATREDRVTWHCAPTSQGWSTLGAQRLRCSDDVMSGSAGLLISTGAMASARLQQVLRLPSWTPLTGEQRSSDRRHRPSLAYHTAAQGRTSV